MQKVRLCQTATRDMRMRARKASMAVFLQKAGEERAQDCMEGLRESEKRAKTRRDRLHSKK